VIKLRADLQLVQELMRKKANNDSSDDESSIEELPYVKLDNEMRILSIDVTFDGIQNNYH
jgi:hypothetical protein